MRLKLAFETEKTEFEKLKEQEAIANKTGEASVLYDNLVNVQDEKEDEAEIPSEVSEEVDSTNPPEEDAVAQEAIRLFFKTEARQESLAQESLSSTVGSVVSAAGAVAGFTLDAVKAAIVLIGTLGIVYGPSIVKNVYKGVIYAFGKLVKLLVISTRAISEFIDRRTNSLENIKKSIAEHRKSLELVSTKQESSSDDSSASDAFYGDVKVINSLKIGQSTDFKANVSVLNGFLKNTINGIFDGINDDIGLMKYTMSSFQGNEKGYVVSSVLLNNKKIPGLIEGKVDGFSFKTDYTISYRSKVTLPSDVVLMCNFPRSELENVEQMSQAYNDSTIILGVDSSSFRSIEQIKYLDAAELSAFLDSLDKLCDTCIEQESYYQRLQQQRSGLKFNLRNFFAKIASSPSKVSLSDSRFEHVYLKATFIDKVYLVAAMDIHDYATKVLTSGLSFVKANIRQLS